MAITVPTALTLFYSVHVLSFACIVLAAIPAPLSLESGADTAPINCARVTSSVAPCIPYLTNPGAALLTPACCNGIRMLDGAARSTTDRQSVCRCLKSASESFPGIDYDFASQLPTRCGINTAYSFSPSTDCYSVK